MVKSEPEGDIYIYAQPLHKGKKKFYTQPKENFTVTVTHLIKKVSACIASFSNTIAKKTLDVVAIVEDSYFKVTVVH